MHNNRILLGVGRPISHTGQGKADMKKSTKSFKPTSSMSSMKARKAK
jgi:hypothetical protein